MTAITENSPNRELTDAERSLVHRMLEHGGPNARNFLAQLSNAQVTAWRCLCGCASLKFSIIGQLEPKPASGLRPLADGIFGEEGDQSGIFVYEQRGVLAGLEVYGLSGDAARALPTPEGVYIIPPAISAA